MTLYFKGQTFKYEIESVCKLFFPLMRFSYGYEEMPGEESDYVFTEREQDKNKTVLTVKICLDNVTRQSEIRREGPVTDKECERLLCVLIYQILTKWLQITPEWGILTGVRPVNLIQKERAAGKSDREIAVWLQNDYFVSDEKLRLAFAAANVQTPILESLPEHSYSLYIAIPFCVSRCSYCSFVSHAITGKKSLELVDEYVRLLCRELKATAQMASELSLKLDTIYIGGGTPTALTAAQLTTVTDAVKLYFDVDSAREYTIEAGRPDTITEEKLQVIKAGGANRISVNPQTFNDAVLQEIGRRHTAKQAVNAYRMVQKYEFDAVNMDFIASLPKDNLKSFEKTMRQAVLLSPDNVTVHTLTVKRSAALFTEQKNFKGASIDETAQMTAYAQKVLMEAGYRPYYLYRQKNTIGNLENVGYAKPGKESFYNVYIMEENQTILSCGAGGVTKIVGEGDHPIHRIFNFKYHFEYINRFDEILNRKELVKQYYGRAGK